MPSDRGNLSIHVIFRGISPKILFCDPLNMIAFFHEDLAREYEKLVGYTWWKNHADSKSDCQFAPRAIPGYLEVDLIQIIQYKVEIQLQHT